MCVDKHHFTCCCGCTLHCGTITIVVLQLLACIGYGFESMWLPFSFSLMLGVTPLAIFFKPNDVKVRKIAFYIYAVLTGCQVLGVFIVIIFFFNGRWAATYCLGDYGYTGKGAAYVACLQTAKILGYVFTGYFLLIWFPISGLFTRILYYGWK